MCVGYYWLVEDHLRDLELKIVVSDHVLGIKPGFWRGAISTLT